MKKSDNAGLNTLWGIWVCTRKFQSSIHVVSDKQSIEEYNLHSGGGGVLDYSAMVLKESLCIHDFIQDGVVIR